MFSMILILAIKNQQAANSASLPTTSGRTDHHRDYITTHDHMLTFFRFKFSQYWYRSVFFQKNGIMRKIQPDFFIGRVLPTVNSHWCCAMTRQVRIMNALLLISLYADERRASVRLWGQCVRKVFYAIQSKWANANQHLRNAPGIYKCARLLYKLVSHSSR